VKPTQRTEGFGEQCAQFAHDFRLACRTLRGTPVFAVSVVATLVLIIGMNTAVFSVFNAVLLRPLSYPASDRLLWISTYDDNAREEIVPRFDFRAWRGQTARVFDRMVGYRSQDLTVGTGAGAVQARVAFVSDDFWPVVGPVMMSGRAALEGSPPGLVLSHGLYQREFGGDPSIVGRAITLDGQPLTVTGVLSPDFRFQLIPPPRRTPDAKDIEAYTSLDAAPQDLQRSRGRTVNVVGRLHAGISMNQARLELESVRDRIAQDRPLPFLDKMPLEVSPLAGRLVGSTTRILWTLLAAVALVLVIGCANVANLQVARITARRNEILTRIALGAGRGRIARQFGMESGILAGIAAATGLLVAWWATRAITAAFPAAIPRFTETTIDGRVVAFVAAVSAATALTFGVVPALSAWRANRVDGFGRGRVTATPGALRRRAGLVVMEIALAVVLLTGAGLLLRSAARLNEHPPGFHPESILVMKTPLSGQGYLDRTARNRYISTVLDRTAHLPGVDAVGVTPDSPIRTGFFARGNELLPPGQLRIPTTLNAASAGYARVMGLRILAGRWITDTETAPVVVLNESLARREFGDADPVGRQVVVEGIWLGQRTGYSTVVGLVSDVKDSRLDAPAEPQIYMPFAHVPLGQGISIVARTSIDPASLASTMRTVMSGIDRSQSIYDVRTLDATLADSISSRRLVTFLLELFAVVALLLVLIGIYGAMAFFVGQRTREIGVRLAIGATAGRVWLMVTRKGMAVAAAGLALGLVIAAELTHAMSALLYEVSPTDLPTYAGVVAVVGMFSLFACSGPALRAALINPVDTLRSE
jgi:putative ABC transport system permease protein